MRVPSSFLACLLTVACAAAQAQTTPAAAAQTVAPPPSLATTRTATLRELGVDYEMTLRGIQGSAGVAFGVRTDELVDAANLQLRYSYSPALLPDVSHVKVTINGVTVATLPAVPAQAGKPQLASIPVDPRLITDYNRVNLQLIGHYTRGCEDPDHTSLWANIDTSSTLSLTTTPVALADNLALLPVPFFDRRDTRALRLPFHFPQAPDTDTLEAAGILASWFGAEAGYRGASFPVSSSALPATGNGVVLATERTLPAELAKVAPEIGGPMVAVVANPNDATGKLLLVLGRNAKELRQAASAVALRAPLTGAVARIDTLKPVAPRQPYDAPRWVRTDRPVYFRELVDNPEQLGVVGYRPDLIRVGLQLPPDLFVWRRDGIPLDLRYRYTVPDVDNKSALNISINDAFVTTLPLNGRPYAKALPLRWWDQLSARGAMPIEQDITLPTGLFSANNQLRFHYFFDRPQGEACKDTFPDVSGAIDPESTIDLRSFHHYMAMPNLAAFGNAGFPFTRMADLSETAIVLPREVSDQDLSNVLTLLGKLGASTGYPALGVALVTPEQVGNVKQRDLLVLGSIKTQPLLQQWQAALPVGGRDGHRVALSDWLLHKVPGLFSFDARRTDLPATSEISVQPRADDVLMMGFQSPQQDGRSVVALQAEDPANLLELFDAWSDAKRLSEFQGSVVLVQQDKITSLAGNQTYYVGHLPLPTWLRWYFSTHPIALAAAVVLLSLLLALAARVLLRRHSAQRLQGGCGD